MENIWNIISYWWNYGLEYKTFEIIEFKLKELYVVCMWAVLTDQKIPWSDSSSHYLIRILIG